MCAERVASLYAEIGADTSGLDKGLASTKAGLKQAGKEMSGFGGVAKNTIKELAGFAATGLIVTKVADGIADFFKSSISDTMDYARSVRDVSRALGVSSQEASKLIQIGDDLQVSTEQMITGFRTALKQGIVPSIDGLKSMAAEYQALPAGAARAQYALEKFGRAGLQMNKFLELAPEQIDEMAKSAERLGLVLDQKAIQATENYRLAVDELNDSWNGLKTTVGLKVIPVLGEAANDLTASIALWDALTNEVDKGNTSYLAAAGIWMKYGQSADLANSYLDQLAKTTANTTDAIMDERQESVLAAQAIKDFAGVAEDAVSAFDDFASAVEGVGSAFDPIGATVKAMMDGIDQLAGSLAEKQAIFLNFQKSMGLITEEQYQQGLSAIFNLTKLQELNKGIEDGTVTQEEYISAIEDGIVTTEELNTALFGQVEALGGIKAAGPQAARAIEDFSSSAQTDLGEAESAAGEVQGAVGAIGQVALTAASQVVAITSAINGIPKITDIKIVITEEYRRTYAGGLKYGPGAKPGGQHGLDMIVPQGYPADSYPVFASSGERVTITPQHKIGREGGDTIIINNNSTGAAALTMAILAQQHRARLGRSMGG